MDYLNKTNFYKYSFYFMYVKLTYIKYLCMYIQSISKYCMQIHEIHRSPYLASIVKLTLKVSFYCQIIYFKILY